MAEWREFDASNEPETCLWCGRKLRWKKEYVDHDEGFMQRVRGEKPEMVNAFERPGDYGDGWFCGLRCGFQFAARACRRRTPPRAQGPTSLPLRRNRPVPSPPAALASGL